MISKNELRNFILEGIDVPESEYSHMLDMSELFRDCKGLTSIPYIETKNVLDMGGMFRGCILLESIPKLDTSKVTNMYGMFQDCEKLHTIPRLNTENVNFMDYMFRGCKSLISIPHLKTSKVTSMSWMFFVCNQFDMNLAGWDVSNVTNAGAMFGNNIAHPSFFLLNWKPGVLDESGEFSTLKRQSLRLGELSDFL